MKTLSTDLAAIIQREMTKENPTKDRLHQAIMDMLAGRGIDDFEKPILTVDVVICTMITGKLHVLLTKRPEAPYKEKLALVGGYIHTMEDADTYAAAKRVALAKLNLSMSHLEQLAMFSGPDRDPRGWSATMAYIAMVKPNRIPGRLLSEFYPVDDLEDMTLAFDHKTIVGWAVDRIRNKSSYSTLPLFLMPSTFSLSDLHKVYEALMNQELELVKFRRKILATDLIEETGEKTDGRETSARPAALYRATMRKLSVFESPIGI